jgi:hypothetical protein
MFIFVYCYGIPAIQFVYVRDSAKMISFCQRPIHPLFDFVPSINNS